MKIKLRQVFTSKVSLQAIKATKVIKDVLGDHRFDRVTITNVSDTGVLDRKTRRTVYADSIRRRYFKT